MEHLTTLFARRTPAHTVARLVALAALLLLLGGCMGAVETKVSLSSGERWTAEVSLTLSRQDMAAFGDEASFEEYLDQAMESQMQSQGASSDVQKLCKDWRKERKGSDLVYTLSCQGTGWSQLSQLLGNAQIRNTDDGNILFTYAPLFVGRSHTLRLTAGRIVSSNADQVKGGTAVWYDLVGSGQARATLSPKRRSFCPFSAGIVLFFVPAACFLGRRKSA